MHAQRLHGLGDVVHTDDCGAASDTDEMSGNRSTDSPVGRGGRDLVDEALARGAQQQRQAERLELVEARDGDETLLRRLAETDAGVEHDLLPGDAGAGGNVERMREEPCDI